MFFIRMMSRLSYPKWMSFSWTLTIINFIVRLIDLRKPHFIDRIALSYLFFKLFDETIPFAFLKGHSLLTFHRFFKVNYIFNGNIINYSEKRIFFLYIQYFFNLITNLSSNIVNEFLCWLFVVLFNLIISNERKWLSIFVYKLKKTKIKRCYTSGRTFSLSESKPEGYKPLVI